MSSRAELPIDAHLVRVRSLFDQSANLVVVAEPGSGKTTRLPWYLVESGLASDRSVFVTEPRRLAARAAATFVARELGEGVGERVGYQVRFERVVSSKTRLHFMTEGVLVRQLVRNPHLPQASIVVLDEFHERSLESDTALAVLRSLQTTHRPDLRIVVMSATIDATRVASYLEAQILSAPGRRFDVDIEFASTPPSLPLDREVARAVRRARTLRPHGHTLVFLPGAAEIRRAKDACEPVARATGARLFTLHGDMKATEQDAALRPSSEPKVILSTNVAESSVTVEGVEFVIDSGLSRVPVSSDWSGLPRLVTSPISRASCEQRAGRAGRTGPGTCIRLFTQHDFSARPAFDTPAIQRSDLSEIALYLKALGIRDLEGFNWFEPPKKNAIDSASHLLTRLGALASDGHLSNLGRKMLELPLHPRLSRVVLEAQSRSIARLGCLVAATVSERDPRRRAFGQHGGSAIDPRHIDVLDLALELADFIDGYRGSGDEPFDSRITSAIASLRTNIERALGGSRDADDNDAAEQSAQWALLSGFSDRVARRKRRDSSELTMVGGQSIHLPKGAMDEAEFVVVIDAEPGSRTTVVRRASAIEPEWLLELHPTRIQESRASDFNRETEKLEEQVRLMYDDLVLDESTRPCASGDAATDRLFQAALDAGFETLWDMNKIASVRSRIDFAAGFASNLARWDDGALREALKALCVGKTSFSELKRASLFDHLWSSLDSGGLRALDAVAPETVDLPGRRRVVVHYEEGKPPWVASRLQDFFGLLAGPKVGNGKVPLVLHLLAPNQRAVQVTTDLEGFWKHHYPKLRKSLMRRYPRHAWPENPLA